MGAGMGKQGGEDKATITLDGQTERQSFVDIKGTQ